jgi:N-acetylglucosaminyl-diphospho-decaprenol L-rhamnosyltransferase
MRPSLILADGRPTGLDYCEDACRRLVELAGITPADRIVLFGAGQGDFIRVLREGNPDQGRLAVVEPFPEVAARHARKARSPGSSFTLFPVSDLNRDLPALALWARENEATLGRCKYLVHPLYASLLMEPSFPFAGGKEHPFHPWWSYFNTGDDLNQPSILLRESGPRFAWKIGAILLQGFLAALPGLATLLVDPPAPFAPKRDTDVLSLVIVTYRRAERLQRLLDSLALHPPRGRYEAVVVKNGDDLETDTVLERMRDRGLPLEVVRPGENVGAARGRNLGAARCAGDAIVFLDDDVVFLGTGWDDVLREALDHHPQIGATGAFGVIYYSDDTDDFIQRFTIPGHVVPVAWQSGFCLAVKRAALEAIGGWDEKTYDLVGAEDMGLGYALREQGWQTVSTRTPLEPDLLVHEIAHAQEGDRQRAARDKGWAGFLGRWGSPRRLLVKSRMRVAT